jgi:hypothetical protein
VRAEKKEVRTVRVNGETEGAGGVVSESRRSWGGEGERWVRRYS